MSKAPLFTLIVPIALLALPSFAQEQDEPLVFTNADLPALPEGVSPSPADPAAPAATTSAGLTLPGSSEPRDSNGRGEGWWRHRLMVKELEVHQARVTAQKLNVRYLNGDQLEDPTLGRRLFDATERMKQLEAELAEIPEEFRRAGGMPAWIRPHGRPQPTAALEAPTGLQDAFDDRLTLRWDPLREAGFYFVEAQCADCCGLMDCDVELLDVSTPAATFEFAGGSSGRWRVRALDVNGLPGPWTDWRRFARPSETP